MAKKTPEEKGLSITTDTVSPAVAQAQAIAVIDEKSKAEATIMLSEANKYLDKVIEYKEKKTKPLNQALKIIRAETKPVETILENVVSILREKIGTYQTAEVKRSREEQDKIAARVGDGKGKLQVETAVRKMDEVEKPSDTVVTDIGAVSFREVKRLKIVDIQKIRGYAVRTQDWSFIAIDEKVLLEQLKAGKAVDGAEIELAQVPINSRA